MKPSFNLPGTRRVGEGVVYPRLLPEVIVCAHPLMPASLRCIPFRVGGTVVAGVLWVALLSMHGQHMCDVP